MQLKWSLQRLATAASDQRPLFAEDVLSVDQLASDFDQRASVVRSAYEHDLSRSQVDALEAVDRKLATISRDGAEFDADLWTEAALTTSEHWAHVRSLAISALEAFGWAVEPPSRTRDAE